MDDCTRCHQEETPGLYAPILSIPRSSSRAITNTKSSEPLPTTCGWSDKELCGRFAKTHISGDGSERARGRKRRQTALHRSCSAPNAVVPGARKPPAAPLQIGEDAIAPLGAQRFEALLEEALALRREEPRVGWVFLNSAVIAAR